MSGGRCRQTSAHSLWAECAAGCLVVYELQVREEVAGVRQEVREVKGKIKVEGELLTS